MSSRADREHLAELQALFEAALEEPAERRAAYLRAAVADPALLADVLSVLEGHEREGGFDGITDALSTLTAGGTEPVGALDVPSRVGSYQLIRPIGHGGMGSVHLARRVGPSGDAALEEHVAVKLLRSDVDGVSFRRRFQTERQILGRVSHAGIARLLDDGVTPDGLPYIVMEYVDGVAIDEHCDRAHLDVADRLRLFASVCDAVEHAHGLHVVHRDLKSDNVLVTARGEVKLLDFGIAKVLDSASIPGAARRTTTGMRLLTPPFASPEQLLGEAITPSSDVYQLGLLLYRLLTGTLPPIVARIASQLPPDTVTTTRLRPPSEAIRDEQWHEAAAARGTSPEELRGLLEGGLDTVVMRALQEAPAERYATVAELAAAVRCWSAEGPTARSPRARRPGARTAWLVALGTALAVLTGTLAIIYS